MFAPGVLAPCLLVSQHLQKLQEALSLGGGIGAGSTGAALLFPLLFFSRGADAQAHSLPRWCDPWDCCCLCPSWLGQTRSLTKAALLSAWLLRARAGHQGGREGEICLGTGVTLLLDTHLGAQQHLEEHSAPPKHQGPSKACLLLGSHCILLVPVPRLLCFCHWGRARQLFAL